MAGSPAPIDPSYAASDASADLAGFLSRPVKIASKSWTKETPVKEHYSPWSLFLNDPRVKEKLRGFRFIRGNLHVKFTIAGSPFFSGYMMVSYNPLPNFDEQVDAGKSSSYGAIRESQRPVIFLDPTLSRGGTLVCPFIHYNDALDLIDERAVDMGEITMRSLATLRSVSETSSSCNIQMYAWMTDVAFIGQTQVAPTITVAHAEGDESGPVSKIASAVADASSKLTQVPGIGPYAQATQVAAGAAARVARQFGFSRPSELAPIGKVMPFTLPNATTNERVPEYVLATDCRNEMTIDPRVAGFPNVDELSIEHLCNRESYLGTGTIQLSDTPGTILFNAGITPLLFDVDPASLRDDTYVAEHHTPMSYLALLFSRWRGNLRFRFVFPASAFHKAKMRIIHDARAKTTWTSAETSTLNLAESCIVDLSEDREFTVEVGWTQGQKFLELGGNSAGARWNTNAMAPYLPSLETNGMLVMVLENALTAPYNTDPSDAEVEFSVFVSGHDMTYAVPWEGGLYNAMFGPTDPVDVEPTAPPVPPPSPLFKKKTKAKKTVAHASINPTEVVDRQASPTHVFGQKVTADEPVALIYIGEKIDSLRSLLKRFCHQGTLKATPSEVGWMKLYMSGAPAARGISRTVIQWRSLSIVNFVGQMFLARRGGFRWRVTLPAYNTRTHFLNAVSNTGEKMGFWSTADKNDFESMKLAAIATDSGISGLQPFEKDINFMIPGSSDNRFHPARMGPGHLRQIGFSIASHRAPNAPFEATLFVAGAEDLTYHGFIGTPIVYRGEYL